MLGDSIVWKGLSEDGFYGDEYMFHADFLNKTKTEVWVLIGHGGDISTNFEMLVRKATERDVVNPILPLHSFITGKGVHLGMTAAELTKILGTGEITEEKGKKVITYTIDPDSPESLSKWAWEFGDPHRCAYPMYSAEYTFSNGKLIKFRFGSPNP